MTAIDKKILYEGIFAVMIYHLQSRYLESKFHQTMTQYPKSNIHHLMTQYLKDTQPNRYRRVITLFHSSKIGFNCNR